MNEVIETVDPTALALRARTGDSDKTQLLAETLRSSFIRRFAALGLNLDDAGELAQECVCDVMLNIEKFEEGRASFQTWASGFARTHLRAWRRREIGRRQMERPLDEASDASVEDENLNDVDCALKTCLGSLPLVDRELLVMRFTLGLSFDEIATKTDLTPANARKRLSRAVERLRRDPELRVALGL